MKRGSNAVSSAHRREHERKWRSGRRDDEPAADTKDHAPRGGPGKTDAERTRDSDLTKALLKKPR